MKYKDHIINYAIDNKVSLEEAYRHFIIKGRDEKEEKFKNAYMDEETKNHFEDENYTDPDAMEYRPDLAETESSLSPEEEEAWKMYDAMKDDLERLYEEHTESLITNEEMAWVEHQLRMIDQIRDNNE
jgi:hypothetical protein|tara:strand:- start:160 stop:543 length:384 start_codon:yes stop_codon:yes gene_type:complete